MEYMNKKSLSLVLRDQSIKIDLLRKIHIIQDIGTFPILLSTL